MKAIEKLHKNIDDLEFGYHDAGDDFISLNSSEGIELTTQQLIDAVGFFKDQIKELIGQDLIDIWKRLDELEKRVG